MQITLKRNATDTHNIAEIKESGETVARIAVTDNKLYYYAVNGAGRHLLYEGNTN